MSLTTALAKEPEYWLLTLAGELDLSEGPRIKSIIADVIEENPPAFILDMSGLQYLDSSGLGQLLALSKNYERGAGGRLILVTSSAVDSILSLTHLTDVFSVQPGLDAAVKSASSGQSAAEKSSSATFAGGGPREA